VDVIEFLDFKRKPILVGDLNAKHPFWNSSVSTKANSKFQRHHVPPIIPLRQKGDILDIVVHQNFRMSDVAVSDILYIYHLPVIYHILDHVNVKNLSEPTEKFIVESISKPCLCFNVSQIRN
jgi:hypothetical protein